MKGYIEEGAWVSCSFDLAGTPQQLQRHLSEEDKKVQYSSGKRLLTVEDKNTLIKYECKIPAKIFGGLGALIGGIVAGVVGGVVIGALLVFGGPVGWAVVGMIAAGVLLGAAGGYVGSKLATINHDCSDCQKSGTWNRYHNTVNFKEKKAILYNYSFMDCGKKGGILLASETKASAEELSKKMSSNANWELGVQILSQSLQGILIGYGTVDDLFTSGDTDFVTIPIAVGEYMVSDGIFYDRSPEFSLGLGVVFSGASFIPGMPGGNEVTSWKDWATTLVALGVEYGSNKIEEKLSNNNVTKGSDEKENPILTGGIMGEVISNAKSTTKSIRANK